MPRWGLCCIFSREPIKFRRTTAAFLQKQPRREQLRRLAEICTRNAEALQQALGFCRENGIGAFRINSQILPLKTHPEIGYDIAELPGHREIVAQFRDCGAFCRRYDLRTSFHPDQFILLSSPSETVTCQSVADLRYHAEVAAWVAADVINIHGGGAYGDKTAALKRLAGRIGQLPQAIRARLTLENDDRVYTPADLLPVCQAAGVPLVYDVHHHRCLPDGLSEAAATEAALATWKREPLFHISSPLNPWGRGTPRQHHDFIDIADLPESWRRMEITIDVEAKAKELAVLRLMAEVAAPASAAGHNSGDRNAA
jgi:UV DNA damage endonuclease